MEAKLIFSAQRDIEGGIPIISRNPIFLTKSIGQTMSTRHRPDGPSGEQGQCNMYGSAQIVGQKFQVWVTETDWTEPRWPGCGEPSLILSQVINQPVAGYNGRTSHFPSAEALCCLHLQKIKFHTHFVQSETLCIPHINKR